MVLVGFCLCLLLHRNALTDSVLGRTEEEIGFKTGSLAFGLSSWVEKVPFTSWGDVY